jgi:hypothetical protein
MDDSLYRNWFLLVAKNVRYLFDEYSSTYVGRGFSNGKF